MYVLDLAFVFVPVFGVGHISSFYQQRKQKGSVQRQKKVNAPLGLASSACFCLCPCLCPSLSLCHHLCLRLWSLICVLWFLVWDLDLDPDEDDGHKTKKDIDPDEDTHVQVR